MGACFYLLLGQLLNITIHTTYQYSATQTHREGETLCFVAAVPNIQDYLSFELEHPRRSLAVVGKAWVDHPTSDNLIN
ncbi:hypothetical protein B0A54_17857 [Friedmanniomyces endolithicus]|uniref:Secreted protein n=1 Tax=Friedmanniomyces endolithicus TaxID=329885 RepID=A0A4U0TR71_9PEZI|nr:hypothetical protein B0A54_17857 [Friedmanniomyces endolithicus]